MYTDCINLGEILAVVYIPPLIRYLKVISQLLGINYTYGIIQNKQL